MGIAHAATAAAPPCTESNDAAAFSSPRDPQPGGRLRAVVVAERPLDATLLVVDSNGDRLGEESEARGGPPYWWYIEVVPRRSGPHRVMLERGGQPIACRQVEVGAAGRRADGSDAGVWPVTQDWNRATENLFSAWIERLFDDPLDAEPSWRSLHEVTRDPERNFLHDYLGLGEDDEGGLRMEPDCADLPYFLRAYFAWKLGLPFGFSDCTRGDAGQPPRCGRWQSNLDTEMAQGYTLARMQAFLHVVADTAQSGAGRTPADDDLCAGGACPSSKSRSSLARSTMPSRSTTQARP